MDLGKRLDVRLGLTGRSYEARFLLSLFQRGFRVGQLVFLLSQSLLIEQPALGALGQGKRRAGLLKNFEIVGRNIARTLRTGVRRKNGDDRVLRAGCERASAREFVLQPEE